MKLKKNPECIFHFSRNFEKHFLTKDCECLTGEDVGVDEAERVLRVPVRRAHQVQAQQGIVSYTPSPSLFRYFNRC